MLSCMVFVGYSHGKIRVRHNYSMQNMHLLQLEMKNLKEICLFGMFFVFLQKNRSEA